MSQSEIFYRKCTILIRGSNTAGNSQFQCMVICKGIILRNFEYVGTRREAQEYLEELVEQFNFGALPRKELLKIRTP